MITEEGVRITVDECRKCSMTDIEGLSWIEDDEVHFRCDECGKEMCLGFKEEANQLMVNAKRDYERALDNRSRYLREKDTQIQDDVRKRSEKLQPYLDI